jgi:hypothetical protein
MAAKYPHAFGGEWAWLKYVGLGAGFLALDLALQGVGEFLAKRRARSRAGSDSN